jgi:hypothetical protein
VAAMQTFGLQGAPNMSPPASPTPPCSVLENPTFEESPPPYPADPSPVVYKHIAAQVLEHWEILVRVLAELVVSERFLSSEDICWLMN